MFPSQLYNGVGQITLPSSSRNWWGDAIAAYRAIGAASYAASKVNLANPGVHDLTTPFGLVPTWDAVNGWRFPDRISALDTGLIPVVGIWSAVVRLSGLPYTPVTSDHSAAFGCKGYFMISLSNYLSSDGARYYVKTPKVKSGPYYNGVYALAGQRAYRDGVDEGLSWSETPQSFGAPIVIGAYSEILKDPSSGRLYISPYGPARFNVLAIAFFDRTLSANEVARISAAMAAL